tara:strand:+ start:780 stop:1553 length:774 start_codon:yes stop_codon:yes gene_type:complete
VNIIFLCSLPRAGNTVLGSIINQTKKVKLSPNSISLDILHQLYSLKEEQIFKNFPKHSSLDNVIKSCLTTYYKDWKAELIIDRGPWGTPCNLNLIKNIIEKPKFIILLRPLEECLASFAKLQIDNKSYTKNNINKYLFQIMHPETGVIGKNLWSIHNLIKNKENYKIFYYEDLVNNTDVFLKDLSKYVNYDIKKPEKLKQFNINNTYYEDIEIKDLHRINTDSIKKSNYVIEDYLNDDMIQYIKKYSSTLESIYERS